MQRDADKARRPGSVRGGKEEGTRLREKPRKKGRKEGGKEGRQGINADCER